jgi:BTB/POZ domain
MQIPMRAYGRSERAYSSVYLIYINKKTAADGKGVEEEVRANCQLYMPYQYFGPLLGEKLKKVKDETALFCRNKASQGRIYWSTHRKLTPILRGDGSLLLKADVKYVIVPGQGGSFDHGHIDCVDEGKLMGNCREAFENMRLHEEGTDCSIVVGCDAMGLEQLKRECAFQVAGKTFKAHRLILSARSAVFAAMFRPDSNFGEAQRGQLLVTDSTPKAVEVMLKYLYTGRVEWPSNNGKSVPALQEAVLKLADKYSLLDLKAHMEGRLVEGISGESFFRLAYLADDHQCERLKRACAVYFVENRAGIVEGAEWGRLKSERTALVAELFEAATAHGGTGS